MPELTRITLHLMIHITSHDTAEWYRIINASVVGILCTSPGVTDIEFMVSMSGRQSDRDPRRTFTSMAFIHLKEVQMDRNKIKFLIP